MQDKIGNFSLLGNVCSRLLSFAGLKNDISRSMTGTQKQNCKDRNCRKLSDVVLGCFVLIHKKYISYTFQNKSARPPFDSVNKNVNIK